MTLKEIAFRNLLRRKAKAGFVLAGLVIGVSTVVAVLSFGRAIGDAASVLFTAGYTDRLPNSLFSPAASLPLAIFFQLGTPFPAVQERAYASALVLTAIVLGLSLLARGLTGRLNKHIVR